MSDLDSTNSEFDRLNKEGQIEWNTQEIIIRIKAETDNGDNLFNNYFDTELAIKEVTKYMNKLKQQNANVDWCLQRREELMKLRDLIFPKLCEKYPEYFSKDQG
jgi:hypothetical protein